MPRSSPALLEPGALVELLSLGAQLGAWLLALSCCLCPWMELQSELVELERVQVGLWSACVVQDSVFSCKSHSSLLNLPRPLMLGRSLLLVALVSGGVAIAAAVPGLSVIAAPESELLKRRLRGVSSLLLLLTAALEAGPVTFAGHVTALRFREEAGLAMAPRWDLGVGLFLGWASASLFVLTAGVGLWSTRWRGGGARQEYV